MPYRLPNTLPYSNLGSNKKRFKKWQKRGVLLWGRSSVWLERLPVTQEVEGSSPFGPATIPKNNATIYHQ